MAYIRDERSLVEVVCKCGAAGSLIGTRPQIEKYVLGYSPAHDGHEISAQITRKADATDAYFHDDCAPRDGSVVRALTEEELAKAIDGAEDEILCDHCDGPLIPDE